MKIDGVLTSIEEGDVTRLDDPRTSIDSGELIGLVIFSGCRLTVSFDLSVLPVLSLEESPSGELPSDVSTTILSGVSTSELPRDIDAFWSQFSGLMIWLKLLLLGASEHSLPWSQPLSSALLLWLSVLPSNTSSDIEDGTSRSTDLPHRDPWLSWRIKPPLSLSTLPTTKRLLAKPSTSMESSAKLSSLASSSAWDVPNSPEIEIELIRLSTQCKNAVINSFLG